MRSMLKATISGSDSDSDASRLKIASGSGSVSGSVSGGAGSDDKPVVKKKRRIASGSDRSSHS